MNESLPPHSPVQIGQTIANKYRVEHVLGVGGMGAVVRATHIELEQAVALKFMLPEALVSQEAVARFLREAKIVAKLRSEYIARVSDLGQLETGQPFIVMELLEGMDLRARLEKSELSVAEASLYISQASEALAEAHANGIVHRDLKPANLFLTKRPNGKPLVKVLDFGISKGIAMNDESLAATKTNALLGSPYYMSPEQMTSPKDVDHRTDVWSLGVILYELVSRRMPFEADTLGGLFLSVYHQPPIPLSRPDLPSSFVQIVMRCLEKNPNARFQSVNDLANALAPFLAAVSLPPTSPGFDPALATQPSAPPLMTQPPAVTAPPPSMRGAASEPGINQSAPNTQRSSFLPVALISFLITFVIGAIFVFGVLKFARAH